MTILIGYQNKEQCFIVTDLFDSRRNREMEKLRRTKDKDFYMAWAGHTSRQWINEIYNHYTKEEFLKGDLGYAEILLFQPPICMLYVDINLPKLYFGGIDKNGSPPATPLKEKKFIVCGCGMKSAIKLIEKSQFIETRARIPSNKLLSAIEKVVLDLGEMYPQSVRGLASYSITKGLIRKESYQGI